MLKKAEEMVLEIKDQMRGGKGSVELLHIFEQRELKGKARLCAKITLNPGCTIGVHSHDAEEEIFYILSGKGLANDNGEMKEIKAGDALLTGNGALHSIENNDREILEIMAIILLFN